MVQRNLFTFLAAQALLLSVLWSCSKPVQVTGGSTGAGNARVVGKVTQEDGTPATNAQVILFTKDYNPVLATAIADSMVDTTDEAGAFEVIAGEGAYNLQAIDLGKRTRALVRDIQVQLDSTEETIEVATSKLSAPGIIQVSLEHLQPAADGYLFIPGTSIKTQLDSSALVSGTIQIDSVPSGILPDLQYMTTRDTATIIPVSQNVSVASGETLNVKKDKPVAVYYSVGVDSNALFIGDASAQNGTLTLGTPAADNVGVGDEVRAGQNRFYISRRNSSTSFAIQTATGALVPDFSQQTITIYRAFNHLNTPLMAAYDGIHAADSNHLNTTDLVTGNYQLNIACYGDGADDRQASIRGWTTSPINYIKVYTPVSDTEVGISQRHKGTWTAASAYAIHMVTSGAGQAAINCNVPHVRMDGLQIWVESQYSGGSGVFFYEQGNGEFDVSNSIIRGTLTSPTASGAGINVYNNSGNGPYIRFWNNIIYDFTDSSSAGIQIHYSTTSGIVANNTLVDCYLGLAGPIDHVVLKNNLTSGCLRGIFPWYGYNTENDYNVSSSKEWDLAALHSRNSVFVEFVDNANDDFHLAPGDTVAKDMGMADPVPGLFSSDVDGQIRVSPWDVGADEVFP